MPPQIAGNGEGPDGGPGGAVEGFLCPTCFLSFPTPELLQDHYEAEHIEPAANYLCPVCKARLNSQQELEKHYTTIHSLKGMVVEGVVLRCGQGSRLGNASLTLSDMSVVRL